MRNIIYLLLPALILFTSCNTEIPLFSNINDFNVSTQKNEYKVGEEVTFNFEGDADVITFYSGELFHDYKFNEGRLIPFDRAILSFQTSKPNVGGAQDDQLRVMLSTDFNGDYSDFSNVEAATWTDITHLFTLATSPTFTTSGEVDLSGYIVKGKPVYIAFKYILQPMDKGRAGIWWVESLTFSAGSSLISSTLGNIETSGFQIMDMHPNLAPSRSTQTSTRITLRGYEQTAENNLYTETWAVSTGFSTNDIDRGPDIPLAIKATRDSKLTSFGYTYEEPGTYKATFVATNATIDNSARVVKDVTLTIKPADTTDGTGDSN